MNCPNCGSPNRTDAAYCDTCGKPLSDATQARASKSDGLAGMMTFDWTIRSALAGIFGLVGAMIAAGMGAWGYALVFVLISIAGWGFLAYTMRSAP